MKNFFIIFIISIFITEAKSQLLRKGHYLEGSFSIGPIFKHSPNIILPVNKLAPTLGAELAWEQRCDGSKYWHSLNNYPRLGLLFSFQDFRDSRLGWGIGMVPYVSARFFKFGPIEMFGRMGLGIGYISKKWDGYFNPMNNIIGSHLNSNAVFRIGFAIDAHKSFEIRPSFSFNHFSNGASQYPNLGINVMAFQLGILHKNNPLSKNDYLIPDSLPTRHKGIRFSAYSGLGIKEIGRTYRGPKYAVLLNSIEGGLFLKPTNVLKLGITHEYHQSEYDFFVHSSGNLSNNEGTKRANKFLFYVEDEILLGHISLIGQLGYYFNNAPEKLPFTRIGFRYYPLDSVKKSIAPFIGIRLKAHGITAEYFDLTIGVAIK